MCTTDVRPEAAAALEALFAAIRSRLAAEHGVAPESIVIGPCDLGQKRPA